MTPKLSHVQITPKKFSKDILLASGLHFQGNVSVLVRGPLVVDRWDEPSACQQTQTDTWRSQTKIFLDEEMLSSSDISDLR